MDDPLAPIAGISLEQYAELCTLIVDHPTDAERSAQAVAQRGVARADWVTAHEGWTARLQDTALGGAVAARFVPVYQTALAKLRGAGPSLPFEDYVLLCAQIMHEGLAAALERHELDFFRYTQIAFQWNAAMSRDMQKFVAYVCMVEQELIRLANDGTPRQIPSLSAQLATQATAFATPPEAPATPAPAAAPAPAPVAAPAPPLPPPPSAQQRTDNFEKDAEQAVHAVGSAVMSGFTAIGSALDSLGKSIVKPKVGTRVYVAWSDGNQYPGTVAQIGQGQYFVTMGDGQQLWIPEQYVKPA